VKTWGGLVSTLQSAVNTARASEGAGLRLLTTPVTSPSLVDQIQTLLTTLPQAKWHQWDAVYGAVQGGVPGATALYHFDKADVVVSLDADFLGFGPAAWVQAAGGASVAQAQTTLLNVSYDPTRELYQEYNAAYIKHW